MIELLALTGIVVLVSALASGPFERRGISLVLLFLIVGLIVGPYGFGIWPNARAIVGGWEAWLAAQLPTKSK